MISKLRREGLFRDLAVTGLCAGGALGLLAAFGATPPAVAVAMVGMLAFAASSLVARARRRGAEGQLSAEMTLLSERLLRLEARSAEASSAQVASPQLSAVLDDLDLLSTLVRDLAETVASHDREIGRSPRAGGRPPEPRPAPSRLDPPAAPDTAAGVAPEREVGRIAASLLPFLEPFGAPAAARPAAPSAPQAATDPILDALDAERVEVELQPIVSLPQRHTRLYEVLARLRVGEALVMPGDFLPVLGRAGRLPELDRAVVAQAIVVAARLAQLNAAGSLALNLALETLTHEAWWSDLQRLASDHGPLMRRLTFEMPQNSWQRLGASERAVMARVRDLGIGFALDRVVEPLRLAPEQLRADGIRYVKLSAEAIVDRRSLIGSSLPGLLADLSARGIDVVAERVEDEALVPDLIDLNIPLAQGHAFAKPRPLRADVALTRAPAGPGDEPSRRTYPPSAGASVPEERQKSFRDFLRRAG